MNLPQHVSAVSPLGDALDGSPRRQPRRASRSRKVFPVTTITVEDRVWEMALDVVNGDRRRLKIIHERKVEILPE